MYRIAILGARGLVGQKLISLVHQTAFPCQRLYALGRSQGTMPHPSLKDTVLSVEAASEFDFSQIDILFSAVEAETMVALKPRLAKIPLIIDKSSAFRLDPHFPLVIPELNGDQLTGPEPLWICSPNCVVIPLALALSPLDKVAGVESYIVSTYQSISGAGQKALDNFIQGTSDLVDTVVPCIGPLTLTGHSDEETKIEAELNKLMGRSLEAAITSVRVPVTVGHGLSLAVKLKNRFDIPTLQRQMAPFITLSDSTGSLGEARGRHEVVSARWRWGSSGHLLLWIGCDNLLKGAALNALHCAQRWHAQRNNPKLI